MGHKQIRIGQLIAPFGPGSIYTDRRGIPHVVCGLDYWFMKMNEQKEEMVLCDKPDEFERFEPRLAALLRVNRFRTPPDFRQVRVGEQAPPNPMIYTPALRFPRWYRHSRTGEMNRFNLDTKFIRSAEGGGRWLPVRFVAVCSAGHLCEFPWKQWIGCDCPGDGKFFLTDRGGAELGSIRIECRSCPQGSEGQKGKNLSGATKIPTEEEQSAFEKAGICCPGERPWLGEGANELCDQPLVGTLINQTNIYFPKTISAILLPDLQQQDNDIIQLKNEIEQDGGTCGTARTFWNMNDRDSAVEHVKRKLARRGIEQGYEQVNKALESLFSDTSTLLRNMTEPENPESDLLAFRRAEFNVIREEVNNPRNIPHLRVVASQVHSDLVSWFTKVNLVERLRETRVFYGFDRLKEDTQSLTDMPDSAMSQLFRNPPQMPHDLWLPAVEVFGEGIYLELNNSRIHEWQEEHAEWLDKRLSNSFIARLAGMSKTFPPLQAPDRKWGAKYLLVHSLAHILINQLVFECGYSTASLRERLYVSCDSSAPMSGILIYTAAGDSDGTMGGLVRLGRPERLEPIVRRALSRASWCSADPVCSENLGGQGSRLANLAACHACILLPETSCETINHGLDKAMVVGPPDDRRHGFMSELLENAYQL